MTVCGVCLGTGKRVTPDGITLRCECQPPPVEESPEPEKPKRKPSA